jgi:hypothetical protein
MLAQEVVFSRVRWRDMQTTPTKPCTRALAPRHRAEKGPVDVIGFIIGILASGHIGVLNFLLNIFAF